MDVILQTVVPAAGQLNTAVNACLAAAAHLEKLRKRKDGIKGLQTCGLTRTYSCACCKTVLLATVDVAG